MPQSLNEIILTGEERAALEALARTARGRADLARRTRMILRLAGGASYSELIASGREFPLDRQVEATLPRSARRRARGPASQKRSDRADAGPRSANLVVDAKAAGERGATQWSTRTLAAALGLSSHTFVQRAWKRAGLQPHRLERYMRSTDPDFETNAADVIGLYRAPPQHAVVFCLDEKTAIQALDRVDPRLPLSPGRAERHGFEYKRHGTLSLYAALNTQTGEVLGQTAARHTSADFVAFLTEVVASQPTAPEIHIILDNLATHKTQQVRAFLAQHPRVQLHFTPTYSSWLNQVELWFATIERDILARGIFTSVADLKRKILKYVRHYNKTARPVRWTYADPSRRIA